MSGRPLPVGPWRGAAGLLDAEAIPDNILLVADDVELDVSGELVERLTSRTSNVNYGGDVQDLRVEIIGHFKHIDFSDGDISGYTTFVTTERDLGAIITQTLLARNFKSNTVFQVDPGVEDLAGQYLHVIQHRNKAYVLNSSQTFCGVWTPHATDPALAGTFVRTNFIPWGFKGVVFKSRLFILQDRASVDNRSRIYYSEPDTSVTDWNTAASWPVTNFFDVGGPEDDITGALVFNDQLYIFKEDSTWVFDFQAVPGTDGVLRKINSSVGATHKHAYIADDTAVYVQHTTGIYRLINNQYYRISDGVIDTKTEFNSILFIWDDKLINSRSDGLWYIYNIPLDSWTRWKNMKEVKGFPIIEIDSNGIPSLIWLNRVNNVIKVRQLSLADSFYGTFTVVEDKPAIRIKTKSYDFATPDTWKRMFFWVLGLKYGKSDITCVAYRDENSALDEISPISESTSTTVSAPGSSVGRVLLKLKGAFRFRQVSFEITTAYPANITPAFNARTRIFNVLAYVSDAASFSKAKNVS